MVKVALFKQFAELGRALPMAGGGGDKHCDVIGSAFLQHQNRHAGIGKEKAAEPYGSEVYRILGLG